MTTALGLFHFNIQYIAGDKFSYHRYARQAVIPFLKLISEDSHYRVSFEISGTGLEFLAEHYPEAISLLRSLIDQGNIELISSTYAPTIWVAFPLRDLRKSIELNQIVLRRLGLVTAPIFFSQEAFFGYGLSEIADLFPVVLCKDDYVTHYAPSMLRADAYQLDTQKVLIGRGHWRNFVGDTRSHESVNGTEKGEDRSPAFWYHMGSGHHLVASAQPAQWAHFFADDTRIEASRRCLQRLVDTGMQLGTIMEYASSLNDIDLPSWPFLPEGSWNARVSNGVYAWMGHLANQWEADGELLGIVWRARRLVRELDSLMADAPEGRNALLSERLLEAWRLLVIAESSDPLGWEPLSGEVLFGRVAGEQALQFAAGLLSSWPESERRQEPRPTKLNPMIPVIPYANCELVGARGEIRWTASSATEQICDIEFTAVDSVAGVKIAKSAELCIYSPTGLEEEFRILDPSMLDCEHVYLPLANGFISLSDDTHFVRINEYGQVAVCVSKNITWLSIVTTGNMVGRSHRWRFFILRCDVKTAVTRANQLNCI